MFDFKRSLRPTTDSFGSGVVLSTLATHTVPSVRLGGATVQVPRLWSANLHFAVLAHFGANLRFIAK